MDRIGEEPRFSLRPKICQIGESAFKLSIVNWFAFYLIRILKGGEGGQTFGTKPHLIQALR
jgi:hypothetical protein